MTYYGGHFMIYTNILSLCCTSEPNIMLYIIYYNTYILYIIIVICQLYLSLKKRIARLRISVLHKWGEI